jgi:hypothetical protein
MTAAPDGEDRAYAERRKERVMSEIKLPTVSEAATTFFALFSRFEYALKKCGFMSNEKNAKPDWHKLTRKGNVAALFETLHADAGVQILFADPPGKQILRDGVLSFETKDSIVKPTDMAGLCDAVKRVRNNLFHGGKDQAGWQRRDEDLCLASTIVLKTVLLADQRLRTAFEEGL